MNAGINYNHLAIMHEAYRDTIEGRNPRVAEAERILRAPWGRAGSISGAWTPGTAAPLRFNSHGLG